VTLDISREYLLHVVTQLESFRSHPLGFRVAGAAEFYEMQHQLETAGIKFRVGSEDEAAERRVLRRHREQPGHLVL